MKTNIKHIVKGILLGEEFDPGAAFDHIEKMTGRRPPLAWLLTNRPEDITEEDLHVEGDLALSFSESIKFLPENLIIEGDLDLEGCKNLQRLPRNINIGGDTFLTNCTSLRELPDSFSTYNLSLFGCTSIKKIPLSLFVEGYLEFKKTDPIPYIFDYDRGEIKKEIWNKGGLVKGEIEFS